MAPNINVGRHPLLIHTISRISALVVSQTQWMLIYCFSETSRCHCRVLRELNASVVLTHLMESVCRSSWCRRCPHDIEASKG